MRRHSLKNKVCVTVRDMTLDEKLRYGMLALSGASIVFASLGLKVGPLEMIGGFGIS